jgi:high-affinity iron transporter
LSRKVSVVFDNDFQYHFSTFSPEIPMKQWRSLLFFAALAALILPVPGWRHSQLQASEDASEKSPRLLVHLLDYLAVDYGGAVKNGRVLSVSEYKEQLEFVKTAVELSQTLPEVKSSPEIQSLVQNLNGLIQSKADPVKVASTARQTQAKVIELTHLPVSPSSWPNLNSGKLLFQNTCAKCHGMEGRGDGPSAKGLETKPVDFHNLAKMRQISAFQVFNTVRLGVPNTPMAAFPNFSDQDTWNLAFYVLSLRYQEWMIRSDRPFGQSVEKAAAALKVSTEDLLAKLAITPDAELEKLMIGAPNEKSDLLADLRLHTAKDSSQDSLALARFNLQDALADYRTNHFETASKKALSAYVEGVEPVEPRLRANDPQAVLNLEELMGLVRSAINGRKPAEDVGLAVQKALDALTQASQSLLQKTSSPTLTFLLSFGILLREGFEAALLIVALLGVIRVSGAKKAARWVHGGWLAAMGLGIVAWFFSGWLMNISGLGRELMEAITGVVTVLILLYLGFWLHSHTEINRWKAFIEVQVKSAVEERNLAQLAFISFLAAFREAIETVLFLRAIWLEGGSDTKAALGAGVAAAFVLILVLGWLLLTFSAKIPIKTLFNLSSMVMVALAVILTGKAFHSFQEVDVVSITLSPLNMHWDWLGLYPTRETLLAQLCVLVLSLFLWIYGKRPSGRK